MQITALCFKFTCGTLLGTWLPNKIYVSILKLYVKVKLDKMILTHSSLSHYSFGSVLLHRFLGRLGVDPTVEDIQKVEVSMAEKKNGLVNGLNARQHSTITLI